MTTATYDHLTKEQIASEQESFRHHVARLAQQVTNNGATLVQKYQAFINDEYPDAKPYLIYNAMRDLSVMTGQLPEDTQGSPIRVVRQEDKDKDAPKPKKPKITMKEIANWEMGRSTREQTNNCLDLIQALYDMMNPRYVFPSSDPDELKYQKATQIKPHHEFRALQELGMRGHGSQNPYSYAKTSAAEERRLQEWLSEKTREMDNEGIDLVTHMLHIIRNPKFNAWGQIITTPYTQSQRLWCVKHLLWRAIDIPWEHITHEDIEQYYRDLDEKQRQETQRRLSARKESAPLTPEQEASVRALLDETHRQAERADRRAAKKAQKKAQKAAKKANAAKADALDAANKKTGNRDNANNANNANAPTGADAPASDRGARAVANALARHPEVDLDVALENHHATAGIPKQNLTHAQIYDAITAEANFQKRQAIIQRRLRSKNPDAPSDSGDPNARSP